MIALGMVTSPFHGEVAVGSDKTTAHAFGVGELGLVPPDAPYLSRLCSSASIRYVTLDMDRIRSSLSGMAPNFNLDFGRLFDAGFRAPLVSALVKGLFDDADAKSDLGVLRADVLIDALVSELYRLTLSKAPAPEPTRYKLSPDQMARIDAYLADGHGKETLEKLASIAGQSASTFARSFKATTGLSPYQYVLKTKVQKAKDLLVSSNRSLAQIAHDCGFSSQSHMNDVFRARVGTTPGAIRKTSR